MKNVIILLLLVISTTVSATNYYVSTAGNDAANGLSESTAWKTIAKINGTTFSPGDAILFKRGEVWRETLTVPSSGSSGAYLTFGAFGAGNNPQILGSNISSGWTNQGGNIWKSNTTFADPRSNANTDCYFNTAGTIIWGLYKTSTGALSADYNWTWSGNYIYVYATTDPGVRYTSIEVPQRASCVNLKNKNYLTFDAIDVHYSTYGFGTDGITPEVLSTGLKISNCKVSYIGGNITVYAEEVGYGIKAVYSNMIVNHCEIFQCGRRAIDFHLYGMGFTINNILVEDNYIHDCYHTTGVDMSVGSSGYYTASIDGVIIRRNIMEDPMSRPTFVSEELFIQNSNAGAAGAVIRNIYIYSNIFKYSSNSAIHMETGNLVYIYNNTFYGHNTTKTSNCFQIQIDSYSTAITIKNNTFYTASTNDSGGLCLYVQSNTDAKQITADYNIYYRTSNSIRLIQVGTSQFHMDDISLLRSSIGWETNGQFIDPLLTSSTDYHLQAGSPAIGKGLAIPVVLMDFEGKPFTSPMSIGAYSSLTSVIVATNPVYVSSVIQNSTPSLIELTYNLALANLVPPVTAFSVMVNSVAKTVSNVVIAGTKVQLILASPLLSTDVVKVSYTKPATNPLQTSTGGFAVSIAGMTVVNSITAPVKDATAATIKMTLTPNPTHSIINCLFVYSANFSATTPAMSPQVIKIYNNSGRLYVQKSLTTGIAKVGIPINLRSGIYKVVLTSGVVEMSSQKIMVY